MFLGLFLYQFLSYGEINSSLSEEQAFEQETTETTSLEIIEGEKGTSHFLESSVLSLKGELLAAYFWLQGRGFIIPILLEFQTPFEMENERLKWLIQTGAGISFNRKKDIFVLPGVVDDRSSKPSEVSISKEFYFLFDTGLRYDFQPLTISLIFRGYITSSSYDPIVKWALSVGWEFLDKKHIALTIGSFYYSFYVPFLGLSASVPLKKW